VTGDNTNFGSNRPLAVTKTSSVILRALFNTKLALGPCIPPFESLILSNTKTTFQLVLTTREAGGGRFDLIWSHEASIFPC
jgi:hypothetical protein